jgi:hypothetical protein
MQAHLPIEVRDLIYHHLWDKTTIAFFPDLSMVASGTSCVDEVCVCTSPHEPPALPHFVKLDFVGKITAREIVRALYQAFHFTKTHLTVRLPIHLKHAVTKDVFQVGLVASSHLRSLVLRIKLDWLRKSRFRGEPTKILPAHKVYTEKDMLKEWLKPLLYIQCKANFELQVNLFQRNIRVAVIEEVLEALTDVRQALQNRHARVKIDWVYRGYWRYGRNNRPRVSLVRDMDDFFFMQRRAWKNDVVHFLVEASTFTRRDKLC